MLGSLVAAAPLLACGPFFPNWLLMDADNAVLAAPVADFAREIERMKLVPATYPTRPATNGFMRQTLNAELADLRVALGRAGVALAEQDAICLRHQAERAKITTAPPGAEVLRPTTNEMRIAAANPPQVTPGLPPEFADYFRGAIAWHEGRAADARAAWTALLARPASERQFKSTWAAYMLGRSWEDAKPTEACVRFRETRSLARAGFADSPCLAVATLGWEARVQLRRHRSAEAIDLYLEQAAGGDDRTAINSLRFAAAEALQAGPAALRPLAAHSRARRVITAYLIAGGYRDPPVDVDNPLRESVARLLTKIPQLTRPTNGWHRFKEPGLLWLEAVEAAKVNDLLAADQLALAAYQMGRFDLAQRWADVAAATPAARWLRAKLLLREGKVEPAAALLSGLARLFPDTVQEAAVDDAKLRGLAGSLFVSEDSTYWSIPAGAQLQGELGVLRLARRQYEEALDVLLRSGFWMDAAYVAERVLTLDELKTYVDRNCLSSPVPPPVKRDEGTEAEPAEPASPDDNLRYLLARRLARNGRGNEALAYFPEKWRKEWQHFSELLSAGRSPGRAENERAVDLFAAAQLLRRYGMELIGTEVEPDWHIHDGQFDHGVYVSQRTRVEPPSPLLATPDETQRALAHSVEPPVRFHYRYLAADLAWEAAQLMPDNSDETARVLCVAGSWLKHRDPKAADKFYKALVRRCRRTALGTAADLKRWFPELDEDGKPLLPRDQR